MAFNSQFLPPQGKHSIATIKLVFANDWELNWSELVDCNYIDFLFPPSINGD